MKSCQSSHILKTGQPRRTSVLGWGLSLTSIARKFDGLNEYAQQDLERVRRPQSEPSQAATGSLQEIRTPTYVCIYIYRYLDIICIHVFIYRILKVSHRYSYINIHRYICTFEGYILSFCFSYLIAAIWTMCPMLLTSRQGGTKNIL